MKKKIIINTLLIFALCSAIHFLYNIFPNFITSIIAPVNESIFEHLKLIFTSTFLYTILSNFYYKNKNIFVFSYVRGMLVIIILLILYLPTRSIFGEIMPLTLLILFISIFITEIIISRINDNKLNSSNVICLILIIINYIVFTYLTYNPIKNFLFFDTKDKIYGIKEKK